MINVMIAEDELLVRMGILSMINWDSMGMKVVSCVSDGLAALDDALKFRPDIVITDIVMPGMDGISLMRALRERGQRPACIVITALHQRQAMELADELDIVACLVKATMTQREIMAALMSASARTDISGKNNVGDENPLLSEAYGALLAGKKPQNMLETAPLYIMCRSRAGTVLCGVLGKTLAQLTMDIFKGSAPAVCAMHGDRILIAFSNPCARSRDDALDSLRELKRYSERNLAIITDFTILSGAPDGVDCADCIRIMNQELEGMSCIPGISWLDGAEISERSPALSASDIAEYINECLRGIWVLREAQSVYAAWRALNELEKAQAADEQQKAIVHLTEAIGISQIADSRAALSACCDALRARTQSGVSRSEIGSSIALVLSNLDREVKLSEAAGLAGFHEVYFSSLFKQQLGIGFARFCSNIRIEHAKRLLCDGIHSTNQVSEMCGYRDIAYFCRVFKQNVGVTPAAWRDTH